MAGFITPVPILLPLSYCFGKRSKMFERRAVRY